MNNETAIREDQERFARNEERRPVLRAKRVYPGNKQQPPKLIGHEAFLKALEASLTSIELVTMAGETFEGTVKHSDKYTVSIKNLADETRVFFKHAIESFRPLSAAPESVAA